MRIRLPRRLMATLMAIGFTAAMLALTTGAAAADAELKSACGPWENETYFQTSTKYGRVSQRACIEWYHNADQVRAVTHFRVDWPNDCPLSLDCKFRDLKGKVLDFEGIYMKVSWNFTGQPGEQELNRENLTLGWDPVEDEHILVVTSQWLPHPVGTYSVTGQVGVDINDDGSGWTYFPTTEELSMDFASD